MGSLHCDWTHRYRYWKWYEAVPWRNYDANQARFARSRVRFYPVLIGISNKTQFRKKNAPSEEPIFQCVGQLAAAVGPNLTKLLHDQLDLMLACGLSGPLVSALTAIAKHIPPLLKTLQGMLNSLRTQIYQHIIAYSRSSIRSVI